MRSVRLFLLLVVGLLAVLACGSGASSSTGGDVPGSGTPAGGVAPTVIHVRDFTLDPASVTATGGSISLAVTNDGPTIHNVTIRDGSGTIVGGTKDLQPGTSETLSMKLAPGSYVLFCSLPGHESLGIKGTLTVSP